MELRAPSGARFAVDSSPSKGERVALSSPAQGEVASAQQTTVGASADPVARARIDKTAKDFEASFLSVMLGQMFSGVETSAPFGGGQGEQMYKSFLSDQLARSMADRGGVGVAASVRTELLKLQGLTR